MLFPAPGDSSPAARNLPLRGISRKVSPTVYILCACHHFIHPNAFKSSSTLKRVPERHSFRLGYSPTLCLQHTSLSIISADTAVVSGFWLL